MHNSSRENTTHLRPLGETVYGSASTREKLQNSYALNALGDEIAEIGTATEDLTVAMAALRLGRSARTVQRMLLSGQLQGYKVSGPKGPEWRVQRLERPLSAREQKLAGAAQIVDLQARVVSLEERLAVSLRDQHASKMRADHTERKCYEIVHEHSKTIDSLDMSVKHCLKEQNELLRKAGEELQAIKVRVNSQHLMLSDAQLAVIGEQLRLWLESNRRSWWQALCSGLRK